jgi:hypothetical protein
MLIGLDTLLQSGTIQTVGDAVLSTIMTVAKSLTNMLDLPVDVHSLESTLRFVKHSGFEDSKEPTIAPVFGLKIGGGGNRSRISGPSSASSSSVFASSTKDSPAASSSIPSTGFASIVPRAMFLFLMVDVLSILLAKQSILNPCVSKLGIVQWVAGGVLLGFPATLLVESIRHEYSFRTAFVWELLLLFASFLWLCYGGSMIFNAVSACVDSIAPLWWLSYASSVLSLSIAGTVIFCMVITTVLSLIYGSTQQK